MGKYPAGGGDGGGGVTGGGYLRLPPSEHSFTVHCYQAHYEPVSGGGETPGVTNIQAMVILGRTRPGGYEDIGLGGGTGGGREEMDGAETETKT